MSQTSKIEWTDATWNPIRGCSRVSEGCRNCYAERTAARFSGKGQPYEGLAVTKPDGPHWTGKVRLVQELLDWPLRRRKPLRIFVNSMSDLFHKEVTHRQLAQIFARMFLARWHVFQVLTKRALIASEVLTDDRFMQLLDEEICKLTTERGCFDWPLRNVWLGVSVEDQATADERIPLLLQTPAALRWISAEPLLGPIDLTLPTQPCTSSRMPCIQNVLAADSEGPRLDWVVVGGESGPGARPMHPDWARSLRSQCNTDGVPFFFKQWGRWLPGDGDGHSPARWQDGNSGIHPLAERDSVEWMHFGTVGEPGSIALSVGKKAAGRQLDGREWSEFPEART